MNPYQKSATVAIRLFGCWMLSKVAVPTMYFLAQKMFQRELALDSTDRDWFTWGTWLAAGVLVMLMSKSLGKAIGDKLD